MRTGLLWDRVTLGPRRRQRRMLRALRQLDRQDAAAYRPPRRPRNVLRFAARPRRAALAGQVTAVVVVIACIAVPRVLPELLPATAAAAPGQALPPAGSGEQPHRLLPTVIPPSGTGGFRYEKTERGSSAPVTYDPCRPVRYVLNRRNAPAAVDALVRDAVGRISAATGLAFEDAGPTDEPADFDRKPYQPTRYAHRWAPILIAWTSPTEVPKLAGRTAGLGGSIAWSDTHGSLTYVTGTVALDTPDLVPDLATPRGRALVTAVITHELGHVVGLAHVSDPTQIMFNDNIGQTDLGDGDRRGLAALGAGPCRPRL